MRMSMTPSKWFHAFWFCVFFLSVGMEGWAISRTGSGFTLSEWTWSKIGTWPLRMLLGGLLVWLVYHFLFAGPRNLSRIDLVFVALGLGIGLAAYRWGW